MDDPWSAAAGIGSSGTPSAVAPQQPTVFITDQYHQLATELLAQYINPANSDGVEPVPSSMAINGLSGVDTPWCGGANQPPCRTSVIHGGPVGACGDPATSTNTRVVFVCGAAMSFVKVYVEGPAAPYLRWGFVSYDGVVYTPNKPRIIGMNQTEWLHLEPGQRATLVVCATDPGAVGAAPVAKIVAIAPPDNFLPRTPNSNGLGLVPGAFVDRTEAVLTLGDHFNQTTADGVPLPAPGSLNLPFNGPPPAALAQARVSSAFNTFAPPTDELGPPPAASKTVPIAISRGRLSSSSARYFFLNNITFAAEPSPSMLAQAYSPGGLPSNAAPDTAGVNVLSFKFGDVVDFVINNNDAAGAHPVHLHGQSFWVMAVGNPNEGPYVPGTSPPLTPIEVHDVAVVLPGSYLVIRWQASHPDVRMLVGSLFAERVAERGRRAELTS